MRPLTTRDIGVPVALLMTTMLAGCGSSTSSTDRSPPGSSTTSTSPVVSATSTAASETAAQPAPAARAHSRLTLDPDKDYGDDYADGALPVGDGRYRSDRAKKGVVYACSQYAQNLSSGMGGGAQSAGPWFSADGTTYDIDEKVSVEGNVVWPADSSITTKNGKRIIWTNDLPEHQTGTFPVQATDPAYAYDRNPNTISEQDVTLVLTRKPTYGAARCMGGQVGVMTTGAELFNAFDAAGRDAGAWEIQDGCSGHPQMQGAYHYHTLSACIARTSVKRVIGWALDGFPITGPVVGKGNILTTSDLDKCHGITSTVRIGGKLVKTYHYVMTQDFPYSVSCFRAEPVTTGQVG